MVDSRDAVRERDALLGADRQACAATDAGGGVYEVAVGRFGGATEGERGAVDGLHREVEPFTRALVNFEDGKHLPRGRGGVNVVHVGVVLQQFVEAGRPLLSHFAAHGNGHRAHGAVALRTRECQELLPHEPVVEVLPARGEEVQAALVGHHHVDGGRNR